MSDGQAQHGAAEQAPEHVDVLIVGAGISGLGGAYHLRQNCPDTSFVILETFESFGGTWWSHRYPGIRSDSDLYTFGYGFKPWTGPPIATADEILAYLGEMIEENDLARHIRYRHRIDRASWSSATNLWTVTVTRLETGETVRFTARFLYMGQGYYRHREGFWPDWPDKDRIAVKVYLIPLLQMNTIAPKASLNSKRNKEVLHRNLGMQITEIRMRPVGYGDLLWCSELQ